jgi:aspartyl-tRNA(Asn)/glutamyl-tRNA(Gln) amidotransferase subunit A
MREALRREFDEILRVFDAIVLPVEPSEAPVIETGLSRVNGKDVALAPGLSMRPVVNVVGLPAIAVPIGFGEHGLPLSMQIVGPAWGEAEILRIAHAYEVATPRIRNLRPSAV